MSQISILIAKAKGDKPEYEEINFGNIPNFQAQNINALTDGIDVKGAVKILSIYGIQHILNTHGDHAQEKQRGQYGVIDADLEKIPDILASPDSISRGNKSKKGDDAILFTKQYGSKLFHLVMNVKKGKKEKSLVVGTMYIKQKPVN